MRLVVDANVLVAAFLKSSVTRELLLDQRLELVAPDHLISEAKKVIGSRRILRRLGIPSAGFERTFDALVSSVEIAPAERYAAFFEKAVPLAPHEEDVPYLALAICEDAALWSNDVGFKG